jgi:hypothetical protein
MNCYTCDFCVQHNDEDNGYYYQCHLNGDKMKRIRQINNLVIWYQADGLIGRGYSVWGLKKKICWEEFSSLEAAEKWCRETKDFVKNRKGESK